MKKVLFLVCALMSLMTLAEEKILEAVLVPDMTVFYECDLKAVAAVPGKEEMDKKVMGDLPMGDVVKINEATEKMLKALGLDPKTDVLKMDVAAAFTQQQISGFPNNVKMDKVPFSGAVSLAKAIDIATAPEAIKAYLSEIGDGGEVTQAKVGELSVLKLKMKSVKQLKDSEITIVFPKDGKGVLFGTEAQVVAAYERLNSGKLNVLPFTFAELKKVSKPNSHYLMLFKIPEEIQKNIKNRALAQANTNPMEAQVLSELANVTGVSVTGNVTGKGMEIVISSLMETPENAMSFKNTFLDGMVKPMLSMLVTQYAQQQLDFIEGLMTTLEGNVARIETVLTFDDITELAGKAQQLQGAAPAAQE